MLGAVNALTLELITVTNDSYINAGSVNELLKKIDALKLKTPVTLVLDNARYQRCEAVTKYAESLKIELMFLPSYSPNLNLIELLWKFVKKSACTPDTMKSFQPSKLQSPTVSINWGQIIRRSWPD